MKAVAIKKGQGQENAAGFREMGTLRCDGCGEEFFIGHDPALVDKWLADKQAHWLEKVLAEEHERDKKHPAAPERAGLTIATVSYVILLLLRSFLAQAASSS
jgi:hypothetical protein